MKNRIIIVLPFVIYSCSPKYTASFQDKDHSYNDKQLIVSNEINETPKESNSISTVREFIATTESSPSEFNREKKDFSIEIRKHTMLPNTRINERKKSGIKMVIKAQVQAPKEGNPKKNGSAIAGFVLGILSLIPLFGMLAVIPAIVFSIIGLNSEKRKLAIAGLIMGSVGILIAILGFIAWSNWG